MINEGRIGRFEVKRRIGRGGVGEVSLVFDPDYNREIALKVIHTGIVDPEMLEAEKRGAEIQEQLSREVPQIARVYEKGQIEDKFYIAMEFVDGDDLSNLLHSPLLPRRALDFATQLCSILEACGRVPLVGKGQQDRVVHGDIKPQNIRIEAGGRVRLLDFGVAKSVSLTQKYTGNVFGSIPYLSPERLGSNRVNAESDLWSVSVVLYQMLTGELPYDADTEEGLKAQIQRGRLRQPFPALLSQELQQILTRCLQLNPSDRYPNAVSLREALEGVELVEVSVDSRGGDETQRTSPPLSVPWEGASPPASTPPARRSFWARLQVRFSREPRAELLQQQERLRRIREAVSTRARHFGNATASLQGEMDKTSRQIRISRDQVRQYKERVQQLGQIADSLSAAIRDAQLVEKEVHHLETRLQTLSDARTKSWFEDLFKGWTRDLQKIGADVRRQAELDDDWDQVRRLRDETRSYGQVLEKLNEADRILSLLGGSAQTDDLAREIPGLHDQLRQEGATVQWLERLQTLVLPLRDAAQQARDPLEELRKIPALLKELQVWTQQSGELHREIEQLERRHRSLGQSAKLPEVEAVLRDGQELRERFLRSARELRDARLAELAQEVKMLAAVVGPQPLLEERLRGLRRRQIESPQDHSDWMAELEQARELFRTIAKNQESALGEGLARHVEQLRERLQTLHGIPLSAAVRQESENLEDEIRELAQPGGDGQTLRRLRRAGEIEQRIEQLRQQATNDLEVLSRQKSLLREHHADLQAEARQIGIELNDLLQRIDGVDTGTLLEAARQEADSLAAELDALRRDFEEQCRKILGERMSEIVSISEALQRIGRTFPSPALSALASGASPKEAARAVAAGRELTHLAQDAVAQAFQTQEEILRQARSVLGQDHPDVLGPDERKAAEARLAEIDRELANEDRGLVSRLERRAKLIESCGPLLSRLHQDQRRARERLEALIQRLQKPEAVDLRRFCPELTDRIAGLVYGIPANPWQWQAVQDQLSEAEGLLARVETHSLRLAAEELSRAVQNLWPGEGDPDDPLFTDLSRYPQATLPPWPVRQKILEAHERLSQARGGRA
jgi:serine/threonine protein kinase